MNEAIAASPAFRGISPANLERLDSSGTRIALHAGEILFARGDTADALYLVVEGRLDVLMPGVSGEEISVAQLCAGDLAGEIQLLTGGTRGATVRAIGAAKVIHFSSGVFEHLAETEEMFFRRLRDTVLERLRHDHLAAILPLLFGELDLRQMGEIETLGRWVKLPKGAVLFHQGDEGDGAYLLVTGQLRASVRQADGTFRLAKHIRHGELVGEMAILSDERRAATIHATRECDLMFFPAQEFTVLLEKHPKLMLAIARLTFDRLRSAMNRAYPRLAGTSVTALVAVSADVPLADFARRLATEMAARCTVLHVDRQRLQSILGAPDNSAAAREILINARFPAWLCSVEGKYRFILLETDWSDGHWTERCIQQADQVITAGVAGGNPALSGMEAARIYNEADSGEVQKRLVLIHPDDCDRPAGTAAWLQHRKVEMHHHVRLANSGDLQRLARFLTGSAICVALGGGGARGFAHIGAFRALREAGTPIDIVGGTSMGSVIGAEHALGMSPEAMLMANASLFSNRGLLMDITLPLLSFTTGGAYAGTLKRTFGEARIEDLWIPYFCVSSNISRAERAIHKTGTLWRKVRASSGVQGMFPPVVIDGDLHVDGAPFSNLPADAMRAVCEEGEVIAIDVTPPVDLVGNSDYGDVVSGWRILWKRWFPGPENFRCADIGTVMQRSGEAVSMANQKLAIERMSDYYLRLPVQEIGMFAFGELGRLERIGYEYTKRMIEEWRAAGKWIK